MLVMARVPTSKRIFLKCFFNIDSTFVDNKTTTLATNNNKQQQRYGMPVGVCLYVYTNSIYVTCQIFKIILNSNHV